MDNRITIGDILFFATELDHPPHLSVGHQSDHISVSAAQEEGIGIREQDEGDR
jgi:hypothetical protein